MYSSILLQFNGNGGSAPRRNRVFSVAAARWHVFAGQALRIYLCDPKVMGIYSGARTEGLAVFYYEGIYVCWEVGAERTTRVG